MFKGNPWTSDEIEMLDMLLKNDIGPRQACKVLHRSRFATEHAVKNMIFQQLLTHTPYEIAARYNKDVDWVTEGIVSPKYNINHETDECESECGESVAEEKSRSISDIVTTYVLIGTTSALFSLVTLGVGYYAHILCLEWTNI